jgi:hypothetical protein
MIFARTAFVAAGILLAASLPSQPASPAETPTPAADARQGGERPCKLGEAKAPMLAYALIYANNEQMADLQVFRPFR